MQRTKNGPGPASRARFAAALLALAALAAAFAFSEPAQAQEVDDSLHPLADLTIASEYARGLGIARWVLTVKNETVGAHPGRYFRIAKVRIALNDPVRGTTTRVWTIRNLGSGSSKTEVVYPGRLLVPATDGPEKVPQRLYAEIIESDPVELPRFQFNNATEHWILENRHTDRENTLLSNGDIGTDVLGISERLPRPGGATTFTVAANSRDTGDSNLRDERGDLLVPGQDHTLFDVKVEISLSPGLSFAANQPEAPSAFGPTTFDTATGIWNIGSMRYHKLRLPVAVNLTDDSLADLPLEERCLTAKVVNVVPWYANDPRSGRTTPPSRAWGRSC